MANDPAITDLIAQLGGLDVPLRLVAQDATKAKDSVEKLGDASATASSKVSPFSSSIAATALRFNQVHAAASTVADILGRVADRTVALASEQEHLTRLSSQLHLDFDRAAAAAGRFSDETEAAGAAGRFAAADIQLTQRQLDALEKVAGSASQAMGVTTREAVEQLTEGLLSGSTRGLRPFGADLAAMSGQSHTAADRLDALVRRAGDVAPATDTAADAVARFRDSLEDTERVAATAFTTEFQRLLNIGSATRDASDAAQEWTRDLTAVAEAAANIGVRLLHGIGAVVGGVVLMGASIATTIEAAGNAALALTGGRGAASRAFENTMREGDRGLTGDAARFFHARVASLNALSEETNDRTSAPGQAAGSDMTFTMDDVAAGTRSDRALHARGGGGSSSTEHRKTWKDAALAIIQDAYLDAQDALAQSVADQSQGAAFTDTMHALAARRDQAAGGGTAQAFADINTQRQNAEARLGVGRGRDGEFDASTESGRNQIGRERVGILREQRDALAALMVQAEHEETTARAIGRPQSEINDLMHARIGIQQALAQSTRDLTDAQSAQSDGLGDFKNKMESTLSATVDSFGAAAAAAIDSGENFADAMSKMLRATMKALVQQSIVEALKNTALGIGAVAMGNPAAAGFFAAAGAWTAVGVAAGVGLAVSRPSAPAAGAGGASAGAARADMGAARADRSQGNSGPLVLNIAVSGALFNDGVYEGVGRAVREATSRGYLQQGAHA